MWIEAELMLSAYKPFELKKGMLFVRKNGEWLEVYELDKDVRDIIPYMENNGHPVELSLFELSASHPFSNQLATHNEIGWVDEGDDEENMHEISIDDINIILRNKMRCQVLIIEHLHKEMKIPVYDEEKVIIKLIEE